MLKDSKWISFENSYGNVCPVFRKTFNIKNTVKSAVMNITVLGCYEAYINNVRVGDFFLAPGWTNYEKRLQVQKYDIANLLSEYNVLDVYVGEGWHLGEMGWKRDKVYSAKQPAVIMEIDITYSDGTSEKIVSDEKFSVAPSNILSSSIYDGEVYDSKIKGFQWEKVNVIDYTKETLIPQEGEFVREIERIKPVEIIGNIIDFGQNLTGYVEFRCKAPAGTVIELLHGEILDSDGKLYVDNLRTAKQKIEYIANGEDVVYKPHFTFQGFRYVNVSNWYGEITPNDFTAVVVHSDMKRSGYFECSNEKVNKLYNNIIWSQKGNYLDIPTDCPQRDERLGWTCDAQVFAKAAAYNYDVHKFFRKWLRDLKSEQLEDGRIPAVIPNVLGEMRSGSSAWGDAVTICPWVMYLFYNDKNIISEQYESMCKWINYIKEQGDNPYLWNTGFHYGDWLAMDNNGDMHGATDIGLIATAFYAYSTSIVVKAGKILGYDTTEYEMLYKNIVSSFQREFIPEGDLNCKTQTAYAISIMFDLCENIQVFGDKLDAIIKENRNKLNTGFLGTPYLLHALSKTGHTDTAYSLLLQEEFPSWLYSVNQGATTTWEHWDGINEKGELWDVNMNSFNHYAYGAVCDWMFEKVAGITVDEECPGFERVIIKPQPDMRLKWAKASYETRYGKVLSEWKYDGDYIEFRIIVPKMAKVVLENEHMMLTKGEYKFRKKWSDC